MITVRSVEKLIAEKIPYELAYEWDNVGLLVGDKSTEVSKIMFSVDITSEVIDEAINGGCNLIISHHPIIFDAVKSVVKDDYRTAKIYKLIENKISAICLHTNLDLQYGGMNDELCKKCGIDVVEVIEEHGKPHHRIGRIEQEASVSEFALSVKKAIDASSVTYLDCGKKVSKVGVLSGSGASGLDISKIHGCDTLLTGELRHDIFIDAKEMGMNLVCAGHYYTEKWGLSLVKAEIKKVYSEIEMLDALSLETLYKTV